MNLKYGKVPLDKIKKYTESNDPTLLEKIFLEQKKELEKTIEKLNCAKKSVEERLKYIEDIKDIPEFEKVLTEHIDLEKIFIIDRVFHKESDLELLVRKLGKKTDFSHSLTLGNVGLLMEKNSNYKTYKGVYLINKNFKDPLNIYIKPAGRYLTIYFKGKRINSPKYYKILEKYIKKNNIETEDFFYEIALISIPISPSEKEYIRKIGIKIK